MLGQKVSVKCVLGEEGGKELNLCKCSKRLTIWSPQVRLSLHHKYGEHDFGFGGNIIGLLCRIGVRQHLCINRFSGD